MQIQEALLTVNQYSRPGNKIGQIKKIVVHWVGNANSTAIANRNYFESLKIGKMRTSREYIYASSHYIIGLQGEIIRCVPDTEVAYHASQANSYSIGIEVCHPDWEGKFSDKTYASLIEVLADLCKRYNLDPLKDIIRHYDVTRKDCPSYYVKNTQEWLKLKQDVANQDEVCKYKKSVETLNTSNIIGSPSAWNKVNVNNVESLIVKTGCKLFHEQIYQATVEAMVQAGIISSGDLWEDKEFNEVHAESLVIKIADYINKG